MYTYAFIHKYAYICIHTYVYIHLNVHSVFMIYVIYCSAHEWVSHMRTIMYIYIQLLYVLCTLLHMCVYTHHRYIIVKRFCGYGVSSRPRQQVLVMFSIKYPIIGLSNSDPNMIKHGSTINFISTYRWTSCVHNTTVYVLQSLWFQWSPGVTRDDPERQHGAYNFLPVYMNWSLW